MRCTGNQQASQVAVERSKETWRVHNFRLFIYRCISFYGSLQANDTVGTWQFRRLRSVRFADQFVPRRSARYLCIQSRFCFVCQKKKLLKFFYFQCEYLRSISSCRVICTDLFISDRNQCKFPTSLRISSVIQHSSRANKGTTCVFGLNRWR